MTARFFSIVLLFGMWCQAKAIGTNSFRYLPPADPFYPGLTMPKLTTPTWVGERGVEAVVILAIDDMREGQSAKYEAFLRPILERLKRIDGRAPVSIMTCSVQTNDQQLQRWLAEGLSLEVHTLNHPCPLLQRGDFAAAETNYFGCIDLLNQIPSNRPVAFRMPCCDSMNSPSPRFYAEIFNRSSPAGHGLQIDSSVMNLTTTNDVSLPREVLIDAKGRDRFGKYFPGATNATSKVGLGSFKTTIQDYPYPYVINGNQWEFPCAVPSDWEAFNVLGPTNVVLLEDWKAGLDTAVIKQGVFTMIFHPHGWSTPQQLVELIDYAESKYGKRVKFLNFREALERISAAGVGGFPGRGGEAERGIAPALQEGWDRPAVLLRDVDHCGHEELIASDARHSAVFKWDATGQRWTNAPFVLPKGISFVSASGGDNGVRLVDLNRDGFDDIVFSNERAFGIWLWVPTENKRLGWNVGWTDEIISGKRGDPGEIPHLVREGARRNNGVWFKDGFLWMQNEDTDQRPDKVERRSFQDLLTGAQPKAKSPQDSLRAIRVRPGFTVELVASEPLTRDPIAFDWTADGRLWVVEMGDYPLGSDGKGKAGGRIRILEDTDGDGIYDRSTLFLDGLNFPTGIIAWSNGVVVSAAPEIFYAEEEGGKCSLRQALFTGFREGNPQHRVNGFDYGLDGWIYGANGDSGGEVKALKTGKSFDLRGHDFRFRPVTGEFETIEGQTQYGRHRDDWGNWFGNNNPAWLWHYYLPEAYLKRNPFLTVKTTKRMLANDREGTRCFPASRTLQRFNDFFAYNQVTSGNSPTPYRDELFGPAFATSVFVSEPVHNLVHREVLEQDGISFRSHRASDETNSEFLASSDNWFRPTMLRTGPDGALYLADMYRLVIEHPEWIPAHIQKQYDLRAGSDRGRIYRIFPEGKRPRKIPNFKGMGAPQLVSQLESANGWQRDTVARLLGDHFEKRIIAPVENLALRSAQAKVRLQALSLLGGWNALSPATLATALEDENDYVRAHALQMSEAFIRSSQTNAPEYSRFMTAFWKMGRDRSPRVRYQFGFSLGEIPGSAKQLLDFLEASNEDADLRMSALSSSGAQARELLLGLLNRRGADPQFEESISALRRLATNRLETGNTFVVKSDRAILAPDRRAARKKVLLDYAVVPQTKGVANRGGELFKQNCITCHQFRGEGNQVGPDLAIMAGKPVAEIMEAILDPNAAVDPAFIDYIAVTRAGEEFSGVLISETVNSLTLRGAGGLEKTFLSRDLKELRNTNGSLMPEGMESALAPQDVADLVAFLKSN